MDDMHMHSASRTACTSSKNSRNRSCSSKLLLMRRNRVRFSAHQASAGAQLRCRSAATTRCASVKIWRSHSCSEPVSSARATAWGEVCCCAQQRWRMPATVKHKVHDTYGGMHMPATVKHEVHSTCGGMHTVAVPSSTTKHTLAFAGVVHAAQMQPRQHVPAEAWCPLRAM